MANPNAIVAAVNRLSPPAQGRADTSWLPLPRVCRFISRLDGLPA